MKHFLLTLLLLLFGIIVFAQTPNAFTYQAVARNTSGAVIANQSVGLRLSVLNGTTPVYAETFTTQTNAYGMFTVNIGTGTATLGNFSAIDWTTGSKSLKTEIDATGGSNYTEVGITAFASVPYALVANRVSNVALNDLIDVSTAGATTNQVLRWNGTQWIPATLESITLTTSAALSGNGTAANPLTLAQQGATSGQVLQWNGSAWVPATVSGGGGADNWGTQVVQRNVTLDGNGTTAAPLRIAQQGAATGESLLWNGSTWSPGRPAVFLDNAFSGTGTSAASPIKLAQQGATNGQALKWDNTAQAWKPGNSVVLPLVLSDANSTSLSITNTATNGIAIIGQANNGQALIGITAGGTGVTASASGNGTGLYALTASGIAVYGITTSTGWAGFFDGKVNVTGNFTAATGIVRPSDVYLFDQTSAINVQNNTPTVIPGLSTMNVVASAVTSATQPAKIIFSANIPIVSTTSTITEGYQMQMIIRSGATIIKQVNVSDAALSGNVTSLSHTMHHTVTSPGTYTASVQIFKGNATLAKDIAVNAAQVQIQVINP
ncbi:MAG: hypothetical protein KF856_00060 [Cyclobacteriaceae bacterium]|nr:hypothetical protein [Cyclobacteriaceae bacterium]